MKSKPLTFPAIAVVGHLVKDKIVTIDGRVNIALGGTAYNLAALSMIQKSGKIYPVCRIGYDVSDLASELFGLSPLIDPAHVKLTSLPTVSNRLVYSPDGSREEWNSRKQSPLDLSRALEKCDAVLVNFISGCDVRLGDLLSFRKRFRGVIYCDFHSLSLGYGPRRHRFRRYHPRWREYLSAADIIQMNISELATIARRQLSDRRAVFEVCGSLHKAGPEVAIITSGRDGVMISISGRFYHLAAAPIGEEHDATGCGDVLSATLLYHYLRGKEIIKALEMANRYAAAKATFSGLAGFKKITAIVAKMGSTNRAVRIF